MLPAGSRLRHRVDFTTTVRRARGVRSGGVLVVHLLTHEGGELTSPRAAGDAAPARVGFVVPRTVGPAVTRNLVKRRLRHLARRHVHALPSGSSLVVRALPEAGRASYDTLHAALQSGIHRALQRSSSTAATSR